MWHYFVDYDNQIPDPRQHYNWEDIDQGIKVDI
jgi:hypothetical protein